MAIDINGPSIIIGTAVYAAQAGIVTFSGWDDSGYGERIDIATDNVMVANQNRMYVHLYGHLDERHKSAGDTVARGTLIGDVGNTGSGSTGTHLHFHVYRDVNKDGATLYPVDLSPLAGFRPNLYYPTSGVCGQTVSRADDPIIIEPIMFTQRYQPRTDHYWYCYNTLARTTECYMECVPNNGTSWQPLVPSNAPELRWANVYVQTSGTYYLWGCGRGDSLNDDSHHMGYQDVAYSTSSQMANYSTSAWTWSSIRMTGERPTISMTGGADRVINNWPREDGFRFDRLLLTRDQNYSPEGNIRCGGY